ncbi:isoprenyl transferase [Gleimia europaea]|uniref:Isoprenyl transferase n=1 Tax=Gleimia europaea ACS-120-V-Col10b TaxID=883069 RepID=A0A9W5RD17_9ACTO|nr:isoprenyl transferase [Gleimia europaea]EPD29530.1 di-trans,poly-cis-decaprenylcistransferase [Gleimia europaea ACS-120-V-Col10b]
MENRLLYSLYEKRLVSELAPERLPKHVGVILDGNRRWAREGGNATAYGHRKGADKITEFLQWAEELGIKIVTLWMLSTDNLDRDEAELRPLLKIIAEAARRLADDGRWNLKFVGDLSLLPDDIREELEDCLVSTKDRGPGSLDVNIAVGYGGRHEITDAVRALLRAYSQKGLSIDEVADVLTVDDITDHLYTAGVPDPDLVIRTSGEQRLSGFLLWQSVHSEFYFTEAYWPDFRRVDFLRALRDFGQRERRLGK